MNELPVRGRSNFSHRKFDSNVLHMYLKQRQMQSAIGHTGKGIQSRSIVVANESTSDDTYARLVKIAMEDKDDDIRAYYEVRPDAGVVFDLGNVSAKYKDWFWQKLDFISLQSHSFYQAQSMRSRGALMYVSMFGELPPANVNPFVWAFHNHAAKVLKQIITNNPHTFDRLSPWKRIMCELVISREEDRLAQLATRKEQEPVGRGRTTAIQYFED